MLRPLDPITVSLCHTLWTGIKVSKTFLEAILATHSESFKTHMTLAFQEFALVN